MSLPTVPGYELLHVVGRGGFGVVYAARDVRFSRDVAIKLLVGSYDATAAARFARECRAAGALSGHPHIVVVHDSGTTEDDQPYLVMELLPGGSLSHRVAHQGPLPWPLAIGLGVKLAGALETAHQAGVLHRDVKPENVLFSAYGEPKLVDFGIATVRGGYETKSSSISASLGHAAPEILSGSRASVASDVYALGSTLFQLLTGTPAFFSDADESLYPVLLRIASEPVPDLRLRGVPDAVASVIEDAMAKQPEDRPASALALAQRLRVASAEAGAPLPEVVVLAAPSEVVLPDEEPLAPLELVLEDVDPPPVDEPVADAGGTTRSAGLQPLVTPRPEPGGRKGRGLLLACAASAAVVVVGAAVLLAQHGSGDTTLRVDRVAGTPTVTLTASAAGVAADHVLPAATRTQAPTAVVSAAVTAAPHATATRSAGPLPRVTHATPPSATPTPTRTATKSPAPKPVVNRAPVAQNDTWDLNTCHHGWTLDVLRNDSDADGDALSLSIPPPGAPPGTTVTIVTYQGHQAFSITADQSYCDSNAIVSFDYAVSDGKGHTASATTTQRLTETCGGVTQC